LSMIGRVKMSSINARCLLQCKFFKRLWRTNTNCFQSAENA
jgi:hypothetical protein